MNRIRLLCVFIFIGINSYAQQEAMFTHYAFNTLSVNPGYAGSRDMISLSGLHRTQWLGFDGAPQTQTFTIHSPTFYNALGLGLSVINDKIGPSSTTSFYADIAYRLKLTENTKLAFGIKGGGSLMSVDLESLETKEEDSKFMNSTSGFLPNVGFGMYLSNPKWYVGVSTPKLIQNKFDVSISTAGLKRHYFLIGGFVADLSETIKIKPTTFLKATEGAPLELDLTAMFIFRDKFELGLMGRSNDALGMLIGYNFTPRLRAGYSFDWSFQNKTGVYNAGSHEIMLRLDILGANKTKIHSPRYF